MLKIDGTMSYCPPPQQPHSPIQARASEDEFTFRIEHEHFVHRVPSNRAATQNIDHVLMRTLQLKRAVADRWPLDVAQNPFLRTRRVGEGEDEEYNLERHMGMILPPTCGGTVQGPRTVQVEIAPTFVVSDVLAAAVSASNTPQASATMEAYLVDLFRAADADGSGQLDISEFKQLLLSANLGITAKEVPALLAAADQDGNGRVSYKEFISVGIEIIEALRARAVARDAVLAQAAAAHGQALSVMHTTSAAQMNAMLDAAFGQFDKDGSGQLERGELRQLLQSLDGSFSRSEINAIMARVDSDASGQVSIEEFRGHFPLILQDVVANAIMVRDSNDLEKYLIGVFKALDQDKFRPDFVSNALPSSVVFDALLNLQRVTLSRLQAYTLMAEAAPDTNGQVAYIRFAKVAAHMIMTMFSPEEQALRRELAARSEITPIQLLNGRDKAAIDADFQVIFQQFDTSGDGWLQMSEFRQCLEAMPLQLTPKQISTLITVADVNAEGQVDYRQCMSLATVEMHFLCFVCLWLK
jgi:Ca2+-binding EF-hand superfamily protein